MGEKVPPPIGISGIENLQEWPDENRVLHYNPNENVTVTINIEEWEFAQVKLVSENGVVETYQNVNNKIILPISEIDLVQQKLSLQIYIDNTQWGGAIYFFPEQESESFNINGYIKQDGTFSTGVDTYERTGYVDLYGATSILYRGRALGAANGLAVYNNNKQFIEIIANGTVTRQYNIQPEWKYVVAASQKTYTHYLKLYYPTRGVSNNKESR